VRPPGWKLALALLSLALSLLLWLNGLVDSLSRPSVGNALNRRQLELAVLAEPGLPSLLRPTLTAENPAEALGKALTEAVEASSEAGQPAASDLLLEQALLQQRQGDPSQANALLDQLSQGEDAVAAVARAVLDRSRLEPERAQQLSEALPSGGLVRLWSCEALQGGALCQPAASQQRATVQLLAITVLPVLLLILGCLLLLREGWQRWRGRAGAAPILIGPALSNLDAVLLVAGGFVVLGELLTPLLVNPLLTSLLGTLTSPGPLRQGLTVVGLYLALMLGPLVMLLLMLRGLGAAPVDGWLQFRWRPFSTSLRRGLQGCLLVLPLVSLTGWLQGQLWGDPGGSNPLLELVLNSHNLPALACFALTAVVLAPLFEETIFRGVLLPVAARQLGAAGGVALSALVFAVAHLSLGELPPLLVLGLGLGWLRWTGGRLSSCVMMHALWNSLTFANLVVLGW
jgi:membrane protease YdiL (CAAX protease family)